MPQLIVIEGGDGSGKKTQARILAKMLKFFNRSVRTIDFPQYRLNFFGKLIRDYLDGRFGDPLSVSPYSAAPLYCFDRFESAAKIRRWLYEGRIVVSDRFHTANIIHQGAKLPPKKRLALVEFLDRLEFDFLKVPRPDLVFYLHVYPEVAQILMEKQGRVKDGHEANLRYARKVEKTALWACEKFGWVKIECCPNQKSILPEERIHNLIWKTVERVVWPGPTKQL
ncbi:MAG: thymidylate kinase [Patescibacteria group bacterium]